MCGGTSSRREHWAQNPDSSSWNAARSLSLGVRVLDAREEPPSAGWLPLVVVQWVVRRRLALVVQWVVRRDPVGSHAYYDSYVVLRPKFMRIEDMLPFEPYVMSVGPNHLLARLPKPDLRHQWQLHAIKSRRFKISPATGRFVLVVAD